MISSDRTLFKVLEEGILSIASLDKEQVQPASVDIRLGDTFSIMKDLSTGVIILEDEIRYKTINTDTYILPPDQLVLATTMGYASLLGNLTAFVERRSSLGRLGLFIQNVGWMDPGFQGKIALELFNVNRYAIELKAGREVGQLVLARMGNIAMKPHSGKYQGQRGATRSRVYID